MQEARGLIISDMHKADPHSSGSTNVLDLSSTYLSFFSETEERKKQLWSGRNEAGEDDFLIVIARRCEMRKLMLRGSVLVLLSIFLLSLSFSLLRCGCKSNCCKEC